jgi:TPR repeat protein
MKTKIFIALTFAVSVIATVFVQNLNSNTSKLPDEVKNWEQMAERGDTASLHKLLMFLHDNVPICFDVEEVIETEDENGNWIEVEDSVIVENGMVCDTVACVIDDETEALYNARLEYWLNKGLSMNDPVATYIKGMRLYYSDEQQALEYLIKSADGGNAQAALFCGSAYFNQGHIDKAIKYHTIAYNARVPSAGWHLAMCLVAQGDEDNIPKAIEYMRKSALLNYPEAVLEMRRIEPTNPIWEHKADSLHIDFSDFPIIPEQK